MVVLAAAVVTKTGKGERERRLLGGRGDAGLGSPGCLQGRSRPSHTLLQRSYRASSWI